MTSKFDGATYLIMNKKTFDDFFRKNKDLIILDEVVALLAGIDTHRAGTYQQIPIYVNEVVAKDEIMMGYKGK